MGVVVVLLPWREGGGLGRVFTMTEEGEGAREEEKKPKSVEEESITD